jgi:hypothetical protein
MKPEDIDRMKSFLSCARRGGPGASSGEKAALKLAQQAEAISDLMQSLDQDKQEGFTRFLIGLAWPDTRDMLLRQIPGRKQR